MKCKNFFFTSLFIVSLLVGVSVMNIGFGEDKTEPKKEQLIVSNVMTEKSNSLSMYDNLEKYSEMYGIPKYIFYNIAFLETTYRGPFDWGYNPSRTSCVGALGPMQVMPSTAKLIHKKPIPNETLKNNIEFNVRTSAILLKKLYEKYKDWSIVCGCYNTGKPIVNGYARFCTSNKDYQKNWVYLI